jgi:uncharacterized protein YndB with AHSA1/START domain
MPSAPAERHPRSIAWIAAWTVGGVLALALLVFLVGSFLPVRHSVTVAREVAAPPAEVWDAITGVEDFPAWRPGVVRAERLEPIGGWPAWREEGPDGTLTFAVAAVEPGRMLVTEILDEGLPFGGRWTYTLEPTPEGTEVTITEDGYVYNPIYRIVSRFFLGYEATADTYLDALAARMGG